MRLFDPDLPDGFDYEPEFISRDDEQALAHQIIGLTFDTFEMRGVVARRRVKFFGTSYMDQPQEAIPEFLLPLREKAAAWAEVKPDAFAMALINEYTPGATIGWHRDAPQYGIIAGISLLSPCRMKLRPYSLLARAQQAAAPPRKTSHQITLQPRSGYLITGVARSGFEHSIPATEKLRYSITFRTLR